MTTDPGQRPSLEDDLAFLRRIAEEGRQTAVLSGGHLVLWGVLIAAANLNHAAILSGMSPAGYGAIGTGYMVMVVVGWLGSGFLGWRQRRSSRSQAIQARIYSAVFTCAGIALTIYAWGAVLSPAIPTTSIMIVSALMMGLCFSVTGVLARMVWLTVIGAGWFAAGAGLFLVPAGPDRLVMGAVLWILLQAAPGAVMMVGQRTSVPRPSPRAVAQPGTARP